MIKMDEMGTEITTRIRMEVMVTIMLGIETREEIIEIAGVTGTMWTENESAIATTSETTEPTNEIIEPEMLEWKWIEAMSNEREIVEEKVETEVKEERIGTER